MKPFLKVAVVAGGYIAAFLVASASVAIRVANTSGPAAQASSGMYAFGDALLFVAVFGVSALVPTGAALFFLRPYRHFWTGLSALGVAVAATEITAVILFALGRHARVCRALAAPLPSGRVSRGNRDGGSGERVRRVRLVHPAVLPQAIAVPVCEPADGGRENDGTR